MSSGSPAVNIKEVASRANVSAATVSRVINSPEKVKVETRNKVLQIIGEMNYVPKTSVPSNSNIIAFMNDFNSPFYNKILKQLTTYATEKGYYVIGSNVNADPVVENSMFEYFKKMGFAGIILTGLSRLQSVSADLPVILLDTTSLPDGDYFNITSDNKTAVHTLIDYLLRLNHRKIGFISGGNQTSSGKEREKIFISYMNELGLSPDAIFDGDFTIKSGFAAFDYFYSLAEIPTAIIAANDEMAKGFIIRANNMGVNVPQDISVCGIEALDDDYFHPKITSIHQDAEATAKAIFDYIENNKNKEFPKQLVLPVSFSPGNTCYKLQE